jgi:hypothetical protein
VAVAVAEHRGVFKARLIHAHGGTVVLPDALIVQGTSTTWLQPQYFGAPTISISDAGSEIRLPIAVIGMGPDADFLSVTFTGADLVRCFDDGSQVYRCRVEGPVNLDHLKAGDARVAPNGAIDLKLSHHTTAVAKRLIEQSGRLLGSKWNFQRTRELANVSYAYFTNLRELSSDADLARVGDRKSVV